MKSDNYHAIRTRLAQIIKDTEWEGRIFLVGGCVRDDMMNMEVHDVDIAVNTPNGGILFTSWLHRNRFLTRGRRPLYFEHFGTAKFRLKEFPGEEIDSVQTRKGRYIYEEEPKPLENFGTIEEDASCRDLTINSLYLNVSTGELLDPTGKGMDDIRDHIIRTPNEPDISLRDNAMHILRCIRFAVKFGWELDNELIEGMKRNVDIVAEATMRRMTKEVKAILALQNRDKALELITLVGAMPVVQPFIKSVQKMKEKRREAYKQKYLRKKKAEQAAEGEQSRKKKNKKNRNRNRNKNTNED